MPRFTIINNIATITEYYRHWLLSMPAIYAWLALFIISYFITPCRQADIAISYQINALFPHFT